MKELKYIHITKGAGTTLENIALDKKIYWGRFHTEYGWWHEIFPNKSSALKNKYDWFTVVRNPYTRLISEYYCQWEGCFGWNSDFPVKNKIPKKNGKYVERKEDFNNFIEFKILNRNKPNTHHNNSVGGHFTEQYLYMDSNVEINVLKYENLEEDFDNLMKKYNIELNINNLYYNSKYALSPISGLTKPLSKDVLNNQLKSKKFSVEDLSPKVINLINTVYSKDFTYFNYTKINPTKKIHSLEKNHSENKDKKISSEHQCYIKLLFPNLN